MPDPFFATPAKAGKGISSAFSVYSFPNSPSTGSLCSMNNKETRQKRRPASLLLPTPSFAAAHNDSRHPFRRSTNMGPPSPAPFVGFPGPSGGQQHQWPPTPVSPLVPLPESDTFGATTSHAPQMTPARSKDYSPTNLAVHTSQLHHNAGPGPSEHRSQLSPVVAPLSPPLTPVSSGGGRGTFSAAFNKIRALPTPPTDADMVPAPCLAPDSVSGRHLTRHVLEPRFASEYQILDELGSGGFGFVVRALKRRERVVVAVKFIFKNKVPSHSWMKVPGWDGGRGCYIPLETYILQRIRVPAVIGFVDLFEDDTYFYLVKQPSALFLASLFDV
jgi:Protein kinase domain